MDSWCWCRILSPVSSLAAKFEFLIFYQFSVSRALRIRIQESQDQGSLLFLSIPFLSIEKGFLSVFQGSQNLNFMATENDQIRQAAILDKLRSMVEELPE